MSDTYVIQVGVVRYEVVSVVDSSPEEALKAAMDLVESCTECCLSGDANILTVNGKEKTS